MESILIKKIKNPKYNNSPVYNKEYCAKHKREILAVLTTKCICEHCGREVSKARMTQHKTTTLCNKNRPPTKPEIINEQ